jgi:aminoglycoside phosphotransferase (APT) family kinase protein
VVIDWTSACIGDPAVDVAMAWILMSAGEIPGGGLVASVLGRARSILVNRFVSRFDRAEIASRLRDVVTYKVKDPHMSPSEIATMWGVVERAAPLDHA